MESLRLDGMTIRGLSQGRAVNCQVHSVPFGLVLPPGNYLLRMVENNPVYGACLSIEALTSASQGLNAGLSKTPSALKHSPAAVATLVPAGQSPGGTAFSGSLNYAPAAKFDGPSSFDMKPAIGQGMTAKVIIAIRPVGQNCLVAQAGFSDLVDIVQKTGGVGLVVA